MTRLPAAACRSPPPAQRRAGPRSPRHDPSGAPLAGTRPRAAERRDPEERRRGGGSATGGGSDHAEVEVHARMSEGDSLEVLSEGWRRRARTLRRYGGEASAMALERCAAELDAALRREEDTTLTLTEAAGVSGYSAAHLGRLVRRGTIPNAGRPGAPRIALRDLPRKALAPGDGDGGSGLARHPSLRQVSNDEVVRSIVERGDG